VPWALDALHAAGARVTEVPIYRWVPPDDEGPARRIVREAVDGQLSAVTFTSPAAVAELCRIADDDGLLDTLLSAFASKVAAACVGPVTRAAAEDLGIRVACAPAVGRLGLLVRSLAAELRSQHAHLSVGSRELLVHGGLVAWQDGEVSLPDRERQVLSALVRRPGVVVARTAIQREVWGSADEDGALDAVLSRLRRSLAPTGATITTRVRRGYLLEATALPCPAAA
jgi:uroporphyrinogen-III synthase